MEDVVVTTKAPGKIIISGEHSVVYGAPALAMAVNLFSKTTITKQQGHGIWFEFLNENFKTIVTVEKLKNLKKEILKRYRKFLNGKISIKKVLSNTLELVQYTFIYLTENLYLPIDHGLKIQITQDLPPGCGMGASSSVILSVMHALANYFQTELTQDKYLYFGKEIENLQHGRSSGLDLFLSLTGGCHFFQNGKANRRNLLNLPFTLINTGNPESSTGECVEKAAKYMQDKKTINKFSKVTEAIDNSIQKSNLEKLILNVKANHKLLKDVGVVPKKVSDFVNEIEKEGNAAKISGAGSVEGDKAGIVLVIGENDISNILKKYNYEILSAKGEEKGLTII